MADLDVAGLHVHHEAARTDAVVEEVVLDDFAAVPEGDHELAQAVVRVVLHDVPQERLPTDLDHWLGNTIGDFREAGAQPARENAHFHARRHVSSSRYRSRHQASARPPSVPSGSAQRAATSRADPANPGTRSRANAASRASPAASPRASRSANSLISVLLTSP